MDYKPLSPIRISRTNIVKKEVIVSILVTIIFVFISIKFTGFFNVDDSSTYLTIVGLIYGIFAAFAIQISWERYNSVVENLQEELTSEINVYHLLKQMSDKKNVLRFQKRLADYLRGCLSTSWESFNEVKSLEKKFGDLFVILNEFKIKGDKDSSNWGLCYEELREANNARIRQVTLSTTPLPKTVWFLLIILSVSLIGGIFLSVFEGNMLSVFVKIIMSLSSYAILVVIYHIDSLELGTKEIEEDPTKDFIITLEKEIIELESKTNSENYK